MWALARWSDTYLLPEEPLPGTLQVGHRGVDASFVVIFTVI